MAYKNYPVQSTAITSINYDADEQICAVTFKDGSTYYLQDFPRSELLAWVSADSVGNYWNLHVRGEY